MKTVNILKVPVENAALPCTCSNASLTGRVHKLHYCAQLSSLQEFVCHLSTLVVLGSL